MKRIAIIVVWLLATAWFVRYEAFPGFFSHGLRGYRDLLPDGVVVKDSWMRILLKTAPVGYSHTKIETDENSVSARYIVENQIALNLNLMGAQESVSVDTEAKLDAMHKLQFFRLTMASRHSSMRITGRRRGLTAFDVVTESGGAKDRRSIDIPDDVVIYSPGMDFALSRLGPGDTLSFKTLEPLTLGTAMVTIRALSRETLEFKGVSTNVSVLAVDYMGSTVRSWIGADGTVLRQETSLKDLVAEACEPDEAMRSVSAGVSAEDLLAELSVRPNVLINDPMECSSLKIRITGVSPMALALESNRQTIDKRENGAVFLTVRAAVMPAAGAAAAAGTDDFKSSLESSPYIQTGHPEIVNTARSITEKATTAPAKARAICGWVNKKLDKVPSPGVPSALEVLHSRKGDCNEHTYLFVALARAAGMPAKIKIGLAYSKTYGAFCYHAWPAVYAGEWLEMDPTFGQMEVDATHIALIEGEFADQLALIQMVGKLGITILEQESK